MLQLPNNKRSLHKMGRLGQSREVFGDDSTRVLVRAALELALLDRRTFQIALRSSRPGEERQKLTGVVVAIGPDANGHIHVTVQRADGTAVAIPIETIYSARRFQ